MKTYVATPADRQRDWYVVDAEGQTLGRLATRIADALRGKRKPEYTPHVDTGDFIVVVNAEKIHVTGDKLDQKTYWRHSGYPGGIKSRTLAEMLERRPEEVIRKAVKGMLPRNRLARQQLTKLKVYAGPDHPHAAQQPKPMEIEKMTDDENKETSEDVTPEDSGTDGSAAGPVAEEAHRPRKLRAMSPPRHHPRTRRPEAEQPQDDASEEEPVLRTMRPAEEPAEAARVAEQADRGPRPMAHAAAERAEQVG